VTDVHPSLDLLLTGYFNQDWDLDASSPREVVVQFAKGEPPTAVKAAIAALDSILGRRDSEVAAEQVLREVHTGYYPQGRGLTARAWFQELRAQLEEAQRST